MKCSRCKSEMKKLYMITDTNKVARLYLLCENCLGEFREFMEGKKLCRKSAAYITTMYNEVWENGN